MDSNISVSHIFTLILLSCCTNSSVLLWQLFAWLQLNLAEIQKGRNIYFYFYYFFLASFTRCGCPSHTSTTAEVTWGHRKEREAAASQRAASLPTLFNMKPQPQGDLRQKWRCVLRSCLTPPWLTSPLLIGLDCELGTHNWNNLC